jgi:hypothetical protein
MEIPNELIDAVQALAPGLIALDGVNSVGVGFRQDGDDVVEELAVRVLVADANDVPAEVPEEVDGVRVCKIESPVEPLVLPDTTRYTQLPGGAQIAQAPLAVGTLAAIVQDSVSGDRLGLTNHHVAGDAGTTLWQPTAPAVIAGGPPPDLADAIGVTSVFESPATQTIPTPAGPLLLLGRDIDAATIATQIAIDKGRTLSAELLDTGGPVASTQAPAVGQFIKKRGSQSGLTRGQIIGMSLAVQWNFGQPPPGHAYYMASQYDIWVNIAQHPDRVFSRGGDSGSLVLLDDDSHTAVGLLWGGNPAGGPLAVMCDITHVEKRLGVIVAWSGP